MSFGLVTPSTAKVLKVTDVKTYLSIDASIAEFDLMLQGAIDAATDRAESFMHRAILRQTWVLGLPGFLPKHREGLGHRHHHAEPAVIELARGKCLGNVSVTYYDTTGALQTLDPSTYYLDTLSVPGAVSLVDGQTWPLTQIGRPNAVQIQFDCGYGDTPSDVRASIIQAIQMMIATWFDNRSDVLSGERMVFGTYPELLAAEALLYPFKLIQV